MIRINLLPFRAARKSENIRRQVSLFFLSIILVVLIMGYLQITLSSQISDLKRKVDQTEADLKRFKKQADEVDKIKTLLANLQKRTDVMKTLDKNRKAPVMLLNALTQIIIPNRMWINTLIESNKTVKLSGVAMDNKTTADFMTRLEESKMFSSVELESVKHTVIKKRKMKDFQITCVKAVKK